MTHRRRKIIAAATSATTAFAGMAAVGLTAATPAAATGSNPYIVSVGDSFISGEGAVYANHNYNAGIGGLANSVWQTPSGNTNGTDWYSPTKNPGPVWNQIYGDTMVDGNPAQLIPGCSRSYSSPGNVGDGWEHKNLACSGATEPSVLSVAKNGAFGTKYTVYKPGLDNFAGTFANKEGTSTLPNGSQILSQDRMLTDFAKSNPVKVVAMSIGGNDFGFADLVVACATGFVFGGAGCGKDKDKYIEPENLEKVRTAVQESIQNTVIAMRKAGYADGSWKIVFQNPPMPVPDSSTIRIPKNERIAPYGCPFLDSDLDWIHEQVYPKLVNAMTDGIKRTKAYRDGTTVVQIDGTKAFEKHQLCGEGTETFDAYPGGAGKHPTWQDDNGRKTEWVTWININAQLLDNVSTKSSALHPNYWGQRALASCLEHGIETEGNAIIACEQSESEEVDDQGRPEMEITKVTPLDLVAVGKPYVETDDLNPGGVVTATVPDDTFEPSANFTYSYQWLRDGSIISRATDETYTLREADVDSMISVRVTAEYDGESARATSEEIGPVSGDIAVTGHFAITGVARVGAELTIDDSGVTIPGGAVAAYQWLRSGEPIDGQTGTTYTLTGDDAGASIGVRVTVTKDEFTPTVVEAHPTEPIAKGLIISLGYPEVTGTPKVGQVLSADATPVTTTPSVERTNYRWYRDGKVIPGAIDAEYELTGDDAGKEITVGQVGYLHGYSDSVSIASDPTSAVLVGDLDVVGPAKFSNEPEIGRPISINIDDTFSHYPSGPEIEWLLDGVTIPNQKTMEYVPQASDLGKMLSAKITPVDPGWDISGPASVTAVKVVKAKTKVAPSEKGPLVTKITGQAMVGKKLTATKATFDPLGAPRTVTWHRDGVEVAKGDTYTLKVADAGKKITAKTTSAETATQTSATSTSAPVTPAKTASMTKVKAKQVGKKKGKGKRKVKVTATVSADGVAAGELTGKAKVVVGKAKKTVKVSGGTAKATLKVKKGKKTVKVTYQGNEGLNGSKGSKKVKLK